MLNDATKYCIVGGKETVGGRQNHHEARRRRRSTQVRDERSASQRTADASRRLHCPYIFAAREPVMLQI